MVFSPLEASLDTSAIDHDDRMRCLNTQSWLSSSNFPVAMFSPKRLSLQSIRQYMLKSVSIRAMSSCLSSKEESGISETHLKEDRGSLKERSRPFSYSEAVVVPWNCQSNQHEAKHGKGSQHDDSVDRTCCREGRLLYFLSTDPKIFDKVLSLFLLRFTCTCLAQL
jgi:hypothetical protein